MKANKGFTLIEVAVVLAIIAILAAILTPIVTSYIDQARETRANADVRKIAEGVLLFKRDTGVYPPYDTYSNAKAGTSPKTCLISGSNASPNTSASFYGSFACTTVGLLGQYLNVNSLGITTANGTGGVISFRGPYLDGLTGSDPWANPYVVNSSNLTETATSWSFAVSGGPDGVLNTTQSQPKTAPFSVGSSDDIAALIK